MATQTHAAQVSGEKVKENTNEHELSSQDIKWRNIILLSIIHLLGIYGFYYVLFSRKPYQLKTLIFHFIYGYFGGFGVTGGAHRLWTHRSYKAKLPLRILLAYAYLCAGMNSLFEWVRDHRVHHRFSETDADPHNAKRGLFFSHCGWLLQTKHPEVKRRGKEVDMGDVTYFLILQPLSSIVIPLLIPHFLWGESFANNFSTLAVRWVLLLNFVWSVNSFAHIYGHRPYNKKLNPAENWIVSLVAVGEGWHNYHHQFPRDYKTSELPYYVNISTLLIDMFAFIGWAYDLRTASENVIEKTVVESGDGSHYLWGHRSKNDKDN
ncbi:hypothetical protein C0J52_00586 [Blattella germanica]|nr:hypothetical protein C0J52_00586 [Blattella germanica]